PGGRDRRLRRQVHVRTPADHSGQPEPAGRLEGAQGALPARPGQGAGADGRRPGQRRARVYDPRLRFQAEPAPLDAPAPSRAPLRGDQLDRQVGDADRRGRGDQAAQGVEMKTETGRKINFNAGPAGLPLSVLEQAQAEFVDYKGTGMSIVEHSHRGKAYEAAHNEALALFAELLGLPASHGVIALQGGASLQFAMLPFNFLPASSSADYLLTGHWAKQAFKEAGKVGAVRAAADS